jgi:CRP/FNR family cyclic AMP-dependent transcriptional regulator
MPVMATQPNQPNQPRVIERFLEHCRIRNYPPKTTILRQGEPSDELLYVVKGSVSVLLEDDKGHELVLAYLNPGDFFGEIGLFHEIYNRTALVRARTACDIAAIPYEKLKTLPSLYTEIVVLIASQLALRLLKTNRKVGDLAFTDVAGRVARALLELSREPDAMTHPAGMQIRITRLELGRIVGCSREMVGRVLKELEDQHLISTKGKNIVVYGIR